MPRNTIHLPNRETYDLWAPTYDSDGNILQSLDSMGLHKVLLPRLIRSLYGLIASQFQSLGTPPLQFIDLGCGTGRATLALHQSLKDFHDVSLLQHPPSYFGDTCLSTYPIVIKGLDASEGMLKIARGRVPSSFTVSIPNHNGGTVDNVEGVLDQVTIETGFELYDLEKSVGPLALASPADAIICCLVIEHLPSLTNFFEHLIEAHLIRPQGFLVLSNMHPDMAKGAQPNLTTPTKGANDHLVTGAGFIDTATGDKIRAEGDFAHTIQDVLAAASAHGFQLVGNDEMEEMKVDPWMLEQGLVDSRRGQKWAESEVMCWFGGVLRYT